MNFLTRARTLYILHHYAIKHPLWQTVSAELQLLQGMTSVEKTHLRELSTLFLHQKNIIGIELQVTELMRVIIAVQACLPVLALGLKLLAGWTDLIIYPDAFRVSKNEMDGDGIVHHNEKILSGEAWLSGPVILSWENIKQSLQNSQSGQNVIVHEIAHKLDMLNGRANGMPPLHVSMQTAAWTAALSAAFEQLNQRLELHQRVCINPYAATSPAEFFAVFSEYFFSAPEILHQHFNNVYVQLRQYYRQDPLQRKLNFGPMRNKVRPQDVGWC